MEIKKELLEAFKIKFPKYSFEIKDYSNYLEQFCRLVKEGNAIVNQDIVDQTVEFINFTFSNTATFCVLSENGSSVIEFEIDVAKLNNSYIGFIGLDLESTEPYITSIICIVDVEISEYEKSKIISPNI
jgi:hypothetical protein